MCDERTRQPLSPFRHSKLCAIASTGRLLARQHEEVVPDEVMLGKALGGGLLPVLLFLARRELMQVFTPGDHGSTFGGNPIAAAVGLAARDM